MSSCDCPDITKEVLHVGDFPTAFTLIIVDINGDVVDISSMDTLEVVFRKPDNSTLVGTASFVTDGSDGKITYSTVEDDIDQAGDWSYRGHVASPSANFQTSTCKIKVWNEWELGASP